MEFYAVVSIIDALFKLLIAIGLQYISYDRLVYYGLLMLMISLANIILYYVYAKRKFEEIIYHHHFYKQQFKNMLALDGASLGLLPIPCRDKD